MESKVFQKGNYIYECKSSHDPSGEIDITYLKSSIDKLKKRWKKEGTPSGYYYVFPINLVTNTAREELEDFKQAYKGEVDIDYYDRDQAQRLIENLSKLSDMQSLVDYVTSIQEE